MSRRPLVIAGLLATTLLGSSAYADPCEAPLPSREGLRISGIVRYVGDGDGLCVGVTADPNKWIEIRLADFDAPELTNPAGAQPGLRFDG